jgi:hypothetical protein
VAGGARKGKRDFRVLAVTVSSSRRALRFLLALLFGMSFTN